MKKTGWIVLALLALVSCGGRNGAEKKNYLKASAGNPYEMFVVMQKDLWDGYLGDTIRRAFSREVPMLNNSEPVMDVIYLSPEGFKNIAAQHRNIFVVRTGAGYPEARVGVLRNKNAQPQLIVIAEAPDTGAATRLIEGRLDSLRGVFEKEETDRFVARVSGKGQAAVQDSIRKLFGIRMAVPTGVKIRNIIPDKHFLWASYETPETSQGIILYSYPYDGGPLTVSSVVHERDNHVCFVPGAAPNSYMKTSDVLTPDFRELNVNGRKWYEARGYWNVKNDFMGGPFVSYSTVDEANGRVLVLDFYVYSPNPAKGQRNLLKQFESLVYTVKL